uniref:Uncharacterized protein n=1 Tax=Oryza glumipatula TaxID=40148 RepID=A0A0E0BHT7_9ORYZ
MVTPTGSSSHGGGANLEEARSSGTGRIRPNVCSSASSFNISCLIPVVSWLIPRYQTRYPVSCLVSDLIPIGIRLGTWVSWLGVRPGTRRYQAWYLVSGYHG